MSKCCLPEPPVLAGALMLTVVAAPETNTAMIVGAPGELHSAQVHTEWGQAREHGAWKGLAICSSHTHTKTHTSPESWYSRSR